MLKVILSSLLLVGIVFADTPKRELPQNCVDAKVSVKKAEVELSNPNKDYDNFIAQMLLNAAKEQKIRMCGK